MQTEGQKKKFVFIDIPDQEPTDKEILVIIFNITGCSYVFASSQAMRWGKHGKIIQAKTDSKGILLEAFYQLMPNNVDDGFFDWYIDKRSDHQFFKSKQDAALQFINYWFQWKYPDDGKSVQINKELNVD